MKKVKFKGNETTEVKITNIALKEAKEPIYLTFNFSFITDNNSYNFLNKNCTPDHKHFLIERLMELSGKDIISLTANSDKFHGLEKINISNLSKRDQLKKIKLHSEFENSVRYKMAGDNFWIFRLCPNNNPFPSRIIGKMIQNTFYVMYIDCNHELYAKRK